MIHITNKLVRDKIPEMIEAKGGVATCRTLSDEEFRTELLKKMHEETDEFAKDKTLEELGDMYAVLFELVHNAGFTMDDVVRISEQKRMSNGGFSKKIFMACYNERGILR